MEVLSYLFGSVARVKLMRLFIFNPEKVFGLEEISKRTKLRAKQIKQEMKDLEQAKLLKRRQIKIQRKKMTGWGLNSEFPYLVWLRDLLLGSISLQKKNILKRLERVGRLKEVILSGIFIQDWDSRADILVVADRINRRSLESTIKHLEAELGRELKYSALETAEFRYRLEMGDRLVRDILDYPHEPLLDRFGLFS